MELDSLPLDTNRVFSIEERELESRDSLQTRINYNLIIYDKRDIEINVEKQIIEGQKRDRESWRVEIHYSPNQL